MIRQTFEELKASGNLPSPSGVGIRILQLTQRDDYSADELAKTIMSDPALTGRLLRIANSAAMSGTRKAATVAEATMRLGARAVRNVALGLTLVSNHREGRCPAFDYDAFWGLSLARAVAAQAISRQMRVGAPPEAYVLGLLAEVGALGLASVHPEQYARLLAESNGREGRDFLALERSFFEIDHSEVSSYMLEQWGLPEAFSRAVLLFRQRDVPTEGDSKSGVAWSRVLTLANEVAHYFTWKHKRHPDAGVELHRRLEVVREALGLSPEDFATFLAATAKEWSDWGQVLQVETNAPLSFRDFQAHTVLRANAAQNTRIEDVPAQEAPIQPPASELPDELASAVAPVDRRDAAEPRESQRLRILAVDDDPTSLRILAKTLESAGHQVVTASDGNEALRAALDGNPHVVVADWMMPKMDGLDLCRALRRVEIGRSMYFLLLTGRGEEDRIVEAFEAGVDDFVAKPFNSRVLMARIKGGQRVIELQQRIEEDKEIMRRQVAELALLSRRMKTAAHTDMLTELPNRRAAMKSLEEEWTRCIDEEAPLSVIMIDIDHFKRVNDTFGHDAGDVVLKETASVLRRTARAEELVARLGGEEFLCILPRADERSALACAERMRSAVETNLIDGALFKGSVTCSFGVGVRTPAMRRHEDVVKSADEAVYASKSAGRNRVTAASTLVPKSKVA